MFSPSSKGGLAQILVGAVVVLIIVVFVFGGQLSGDTSGAACAVKVDDTCTLRKEFHASYGLAVRASGFELSAEGARQVKRALLDGFVERALLLKEAERLGVGVTEKEVDEELLAGRARLSLPADRQMALAAELRLCIPEPGGCAPSTEGIRLLPVDKDGQFNMERYRRVVRSYTGRGEKQFKEMQAQELLADRIRALIRSRVRVSEEEAFLLWERENSQAVIRSVEANGSWFARFALQLSQAEIDEWAMEHKVEVDAEVERTKSRFTPGCRLAQEILVRFEPGATDDDKVAGREKIDKALGRAKGKESFDLLARELSDGAAAPLGGHIGCVGEHYGAGAQELLAALGGLKDGQLSPVLETLRGFHLIKAGATVTEAEIAVIARAQATAELASRAKAKEMAETFAKELINLGKGAPSLQEATDTLVSQYLERGPLTRPKDPEASFAPLLDDKRPRVQISSRFSVLGRPVPGAMAPDLASRAFDLKLDELASEPFATANGSVVVQLKEKELATREAFDQEKAKRMRQLRRIKAEEALARYVSELRKQAADTIALDGALLESLDDGADQDSEDES